MKTAITLNDVYKPSEDIVERNVQGEFIIIPITSDAGNNQEGLFSLNKTGKAFWNKIDGKRTLNEIIKVLISEFEVKKSDIENDILGLTKELLAKKILVKKKKN